MDPSLSYLATSLVLGLGKLKQNEVVVRVKDLLSSLVLHSVLGCPV